MNNKRQHERLEIAIPVTLTYEGREIATHTKNLSVGGMLVEGGTDLPFGATVRLRCLLPVPPSGQDFDVQVTVRWIRDGAIGVQFGPLRAKETWAINQLVKMLGEARPA